MRYAPSADWPKLSFMRYIFMNNQPVNAKKYRTNASFGQLSINRYRMNESFGHIPCKISLGECHYESESFNDIYDFYLSRTYSDIILPISPMFTPPLNSKVAVKPFANIRNSSESGMISMNPGVCMAKNCIFE